MPRSPRARFLLADVWVGAALLAASVWVVVAGEAARMAAAPRPLLRRSVAALLASHLTQVEA